MDHPLIPQYLMEYLDGLVPPRPAEMQAMEAYAEKIDFPIIGPTSGYFCYQVARMIGARRVFELGSGYGYSTAWFAKAVVENGGGEVYHVVWDEELSRQARQHLAVLGYNGTIRYHVGEAVQALRETPGPFDLIFNDINKDGYAASLPVIAEKLRSGGVLIVDNMLWHGHVFEPRDSTPETSSVRKLTELLTQSPDWIVSLDPVRDGVVVAYKK
ncbi:MAG TPA: O-methyltransferase [Anaerolineales bacterium]|nr:O-methyltransferase [Anaerolineales bacterium]